jgi:uncharacterized membrane protein (TIGR01666 family)
MQKRAKEISYFFYSQAFADGFRAAFAILLPALLGFYLNFFETGLTLALGAMCVSLTDAPGPVIHKRNSMFICAGFAFIVAFLTVFARMNVYTMGLEIALASFFFSMFNVYGNRAASVGSAALLIMILTMDTPVDPADALPHALLILGGGVFYAFFSLLLHTIRPYRVAQRALGECIREIGHYLSIKGDFYDVKTDLEGNYKNLVAQQIVVNEKQDAVRELFFKTRQIVQESTTIGRRLLFTFIETVDLFESITAAYYDYALLRKQFGHTGALELISHSLKKLAYEINAMGFSVQSNTAFVRTFDYDEELRQLKMQIDVMAPKGQQATTVLRKILVNIRKMLGTLNNMETYFRREHIKRRGTDHSPFISHQSLDPKIIRDNFSLNSSIFRHALRVCIACVAGFIISQLISYGHHSYWILMTIAFMLKPAFSLTKKRNIERITGTLIGGGIGVLILAFIPSKPVLFVFMMIFMIGTYSFMRIQYLVMVICTTPYVLILFSFLGTGFKTVAEERLFDTVLGCAVAFSAGYFLFPRWESDQLKTYLQGTVKANAAYLKKIIEALSGQNIIILDYKLARKEVYLNSANLSAAFQRMLSEPKNKQKNEKDIHQFVVLNHILFSNIATVATTLLSKPPRVYPAELIHLSKKAFSILCESSKKFGEGITAELPQTKIIQPNEEAGRDEVLMNEQLAFICKVSADIERTTRAVTGS